MTRNDTGIDCCNLIDTIVQAKLRKYNLTWKECSTFFGSQNIYNEELNETIVRWKKLMITRNADCKLAANLKLENLSTESEIEKLYALFENHSSKKELLVHKLN